MSFRNAATASVTFDIEKVIQPIYTGGDVSIDSKGGLLATCLGDQVVLTSVQDGRLLGRIEGDEEAVSALALTPDASWLVVCSRSCTMSIYTLEASQDGSSISAVRARSLKPYSTPVVSIAVDETSTLLATGGADGSIKVWDLRGGYVTHTFRGHSGVVSSLALFKQARLQKTAQRGSSKHTQGDSPLVMQVDESSLDFRLASGGEDGKVRVWDLSKKRSIAILDSHVSAVRSIDFSGEQNALITGSRDKTIVIWDGRTWKPRKIVPVLESIEGVGFFDNGERFYCGGETGRIRIWNNETGRELTGDQEVQGEGAAFTQLRKPSHSAILVCVRVDLMLDFRDLKKFCGQQQTSSESEPDVVQTISGTHDEIIDFAFVSAKHSLMALATNTEQLKLISLSQTATTSKWGRGTFFGADVAVLDGHEDIIICLDVDWSGQWIVTGAKDNTARLWFVDHTRHIFDCIEVYKGHAGSLGAIALPQIQPPTDSAAYADPAGHPPKMVITGSQDQTVKRWNISLGYEKDAEKSQSQARAAYTRKAHDKDINALAMSPDASLFASASQDKSVKIWSTEEGEVQGILRGHKRGVWSVKFGPKTIPAISGDSGTSSSKRGVVLTGSGDKSVKIWSLSDYTCLRTFEGHTNSVLKVVWFPPPTSETSSSFKRPALAASAGGDGLVKVWNIQSGECMSTLDNHTERVWALTASPDYENLVSGAADGVVTFWADTTVATMEHAAAASEARIEQEQELANHIRRGRYRDAIVLSLQLNHPGRLLGLFKEVIKKHPGEAGSLSGVQDVDDAIAGLSDEQLYTLILRVRDWNTNAKTAHVAQRILWVIVKTFPASKLAGLQKRGRGLGEVLDGLRAYTERHYKRTEEFMEESYLVDFVVWNMGEEAFVDEEPWHVKDQAKGANDILMVE